MEFHHPVLLKEVLEYLCVNHRSIYVDATLGNGGHTIEILKKGGIVYGIDQDPQNLKISQDRISKLGLIKNFHPIHSNYNQLEKLVGPIIPQNISGLIFDLGISLNQQKANGRGFSFNDTSSLDMRLDPTSQSLTAEEIINTYSFQQLYDIFTKLGQEEFSKPIIIKIISERQQSPIKSGHRLAEIIRNYYHQKHKRYILDPSTKIFMALRIYINNELINLKQTLNSTLNLLPSACNIVIISFHSGEDRIVKKFIQQNTSNHKIVNLTGKPIKATSSEVILNPLSRSAVLRSYKII